MRGASAAKAALPAIAMLVLLGAFLYRSGWQIPGNLYVPGATTDEQPIIMRLSHHMSTDDRLSWLVEQFAASVRERSEGQLRVYVFPNSQLLNLDEGLGDAVARGNVEATIIPGRYIEKSVPAQAIESLPFIFNGWDGFKRVSQDEEFRNTLNEEYRQRNLVFIDWNISGWGWFASKERPVVLPQDLQGVRVTVTEREEAAMVDLAGGTSVLPREEADATAREGTIDAAFVATRSFARSQMPQVFKFYPKAEAVAISNLFLVNRDFWESLPLELQEAVREASHEFLWEMWLKFSFDTRADEWVALRRGEASLYEFNAEDRAAWIELLKPLEADYVSRAGPVGQKLLDIARRDGVMPQVHGPTPAPIPREGGVQ